MTSPSRARRQRSESLRSVACFREERPYRNSTRNRNGFPFIGSSRCHADPHAAMPSHKQLAATKAARRIRNFTAVSPPRFPAEWAV